MRGLHVLENPEEVLELQKTKSRPGKVLEKLHFEKFPGKELENLKQLRFGTWRCSWRDLTQKIFGGLFVLFL